MPLLDPGGSELRARRLTSGRIEDSLELAFSREPMSRDVSAHWFAKMIRYVLYLRSGINQIISTRYSRT
jgi:hypothetical protein